MADDIAVTAGSYTDTIAADDVSSKKYQRIKIVRGVDGSVKGDAGTWGTTTSLLSTGLNSLAASNTAGYASAKVDMTGEAAMDVVVYGKFQMTTSGSPTGLITVYAIGSNDGTDFSGDTSYSGSAGAYTLGAANSGNLVPLFTVKPHANSGVYRGVGSLRARFGFVPPFFGIVVINDANSVALHTTGSEITYRIQY